MAKLATFAKCYKATDYEHTILSRCYAATLKGPIYSSCAP